MIIAQGQGWPRRSSFWIDVGPDGGAIPSRIVQVYEFPMVLVLDCDGQGGGNSTDWTLTPLFAINAFLWGISIVTSSIAFTTFVRRST